MNCDIESEGENNDENRQEAIEAGDKILSSGTAELKSNNGDRKKNIKLLKLK